MLRWQGRLGAASGAFQEELFHLQAVWRGLEGAATFLQGNGVNLQTPALANISNSGQLERITENQQTWVPHEGVQDGMTALLRHNCALPSSSQPG